MAQELGYNHFNLETLQGIADNDTFFAAEIANSFLLNNPANLAELEAAVQHDNKEAMHFAIHKLIGCYNLVGAPHLANLSKHIEITEDSAIVAGSLQELKERSALLDAELAHLVRQMENAG